MDQLPEAETIRAMDAEGLSIIDDKLTRFLCYWLGGSRHYVNKYGLVSIPQAGTHLNVGEKERDAWLLCMTKAVELQPFKPSFKEYLLEQLWIPEERIRKTCNGKGNALMTSLLLCRLLIHCVHAKIQHSPIT